MHRTDARLEHRDDAGFGQDDDVGCDSREEAGFDQDDGAGCDRRGDRRSGGRG